MADHHPDDSEQDHTYGLLPARPITGDAARWLPRAAAAGCLGLTYLASLQLNPGTLQGTSALAFPLFGTDPKERLFSMYMAANMASPLMIWTLEELGCRRAGMHRLDSAMGLIGPLFLGATLQYRGLDQVAPLYFLDGVLPNLRGQLSGLSSDDDHHMGPSSSSRKVDPDVARAVLPATLVGHVVPALLMGYVLGPSMTFTNVARSPYSPQSIACHAFLWSPLTVPVLAYGLAVVRRWSRERANLRAPSGARKARHEMDESYTIGGKPDTLALRATYTDLVSIQAAGHVVAVASLAAQAWALWEQLTEMAPGASALTKAKAVLSWVLEPMSFTQPELLALSAAAMATFGLYTVWDLRRRGYTTSREAKRAAAGFVVGQVLIGPGASYAGLWRWREGVLAQLPPGV